MYQIFHLANGVFSNFNEPSLCLLSHLQKIVCIRFYVVSEESNVPLKLNPAPLSIYFPSYYDIDSLQYEKHHT